jgi:aspartate racemase
MRTIGLVGGLTYVSTLDYYRLINEMVNERLGGSEAATLIMYSVNFGDIRRYTEAGQWDKIADIIGGAAVTLEKAGAHCVMLGANTMHKVASEVRAMISIPLIHIADETTKVIAAKGIHKVALLGTKYTMKLDFYKNSLAQHGIDTIIPDDADIEIMNNAIYNEMSKNIFTDETRSAFISIICSLQQQGAEGVILGCTEIPMLIKQQDSPIPVFDTTCIHAKAAVDFPLA